jgi:hypothetical protein
VSSSLGGVIVTLPLSSTFTVGGFGAVLSGTRFWFSGVFSAGAFFLPRVESAFTSVFSLALPFGIVTIP